MTTQTHLTCPDCGSAEVTTTHIQTFMVNTGELFRHYVKADDDNSPARCVECFWGGERQNLIERPILSTGEPT